MAKKIILALFILILLGCSSGNKDEVKQNADKVFKENSFKIIGYIGYNFNAIIPFTHYGGAMVYYRLEKIPDNGIIYEAAIQRWGDEYHIYNLKAIDAIKPK